MKYRIKITTFKTGRKVYEAQVKMLIGWATIGYEGNPIIPSCTFELRSRDEALERIDKHFDGNSKKQTIEFEYINK